MSSYQTYSSHHSNSNNNNNNNNNNNYNSPTSPPRSYQSRSGSPVTLTPSSPRSTGGSGVHNNNTGSDSLTPIYTIDYNNNHHTGSVGAQRSVSPALGSPTSTLSGSIAGASSRSTTFNSQKRTASPTMAFSNTPLPEPTRWKRVRLTVMRLATVERLQLLWGLLAIFGTVSWISLMPAFSFRNGLGRGTFKDPAYTLFLVATVGTSFSAIWQSLCPFLIRQSQRALLPRIINHPSTQTATIVVSVVLTILNFFSWIILAAGGDTGAHTNCMIGPLSDKPGYLAQCRGVNVAVAVDAIVFLLWIPISVVIVCGTVERGLWWWGEDDGWAQGEAKVGGANMMSEEEFDMKIGVGGSKRIKRRQTVFPADEDQPEGMVMIQQPKPAFVTPIASQFRSSGGYGDDLENGDDDDFTNFAPSSYRRHHQQRQQQQQQRQRLQRKTSTNSLSSRLSTFFGAGWGADAMPPSQDGGAAGGAAALPPMPTMPSQYAQENARNAAANKGGAPVTATATTARKKDEEKKREEEKEKEEEEDIPLHGDSYASQWHSRWA